VPVSEHIFYRVSGYTGGGHNKTKHFKHSNITLKYSKFIQHSMSSIGTVTELWAQ